MDSPGEQKLTRPATTVWKTTTPRMQMALSTIGIAGANEVDVSQMIHAPTICKTDPVMKRSKKAAVRRRGREFFIRAFHGPPRCSQGVLNGRSRPVTVH